MITKKICLLGSVCVGKTSLARRFVYSCFSDDYQSTIGVSLHKKQLLVNGQELSLVVWDVQGEDRYDKVLVSFLKGLSGYILVVDVTRPESAITAMVLRDRVRENFGNIPYVLAYSKCDLPAKTEFPDQISELEVEAQAVFKTSALSGDGVEDAFNCIGQAVLPLRKVG